MQYTEVTLIIYTLVIIVLTNRYYAIKQPTIHELYILEESLKAIHTEIRSKIHMLIAERGLTSDMADIKAIEHKIDCMEVQSVRSDLDLLRFRKKYDKQLDYAKRLMEKYEEVK